MPGQYFGKYTGIVKDNRDNDNLGQIRVSVPAIFPAEEQIVARPALPYGFFFVPENEAKVWVEFEGGDPGLCLWTGVNYIAGEWPADARVNPPQYRAIVTAASHVLQFDDKSGEEAIHLKDGVNHHEVHLTNSGIDIKDGVNHHELRLDSGGVTVTANTGSTITLRVSPGGTITIDASGITVDAGSLPVTVLGLVVKLSSSAAMPVLRLGDSGVGNLGAPVPLIGPGNLTVLA
jgi:hypothetical protein